MNDIRNILAERGIAVAALQAHRVWLQHLERKYPPGPRGGLAPQIKEGRRLQGRCRREGIEPILAEMVDRFTHHAERWQQMTDPDVVAELPYLRYVCTNLPDSRPAHVEKHGLVFPVRHAFWDLWYPLTGLGCMCTVMSVSEDLLRRRGWKVSDDPKFEFRNPDPGFEFNIGKLIKF
jgi:hypothetical protein